MMLRLRRRACRPSSWWWWSWWLLTLFLAVIVEKSKRNKVRYSHWISIKLGVRLIGIDLLTFDLDVAGKTLYSLS